MTCQSSSPPKARAFYEDPNAVRAAAQSMRIATQGDITGYMTDRCFLQKGIRHRLERIISAKITRWDLDAEGGNGIFYHGFSRGKRKETPGVHADEPYDDVTVLIYSRPACRLVRNIAVAAQAHGPDSRADAGGCASPWNNAHEVARNIRERLRTPRALDRDRPRRIQVQSHAGLSKRHDALRVPTFRIEFANGTAVSDFSDRNRLVDVACLLVSNGTFAVLTCPTVPASARPSAAPRRRRGNRASAARAAPPRRARRSRWRRPHRNAR